MEARLHANVAQIAATHLEKTRYQYTLGWALVGVHMPSNDPTLSPASHEPKYQRPQTISYRLFLLIRRLIRRYNLVAQHIQRRGRVHVEVFRELLLDDFNFLRFIYVRDQSSSSVRDATCG